ncbi:hypothetical protein HanRHA438_Chr04g0174011 [Helianthus annuus]|uniref:Transmembrane protein n=1 Tax=Helianthus annuus TaxID=4232 RepID=A0A9K3J781_HELAN|nr:hypothetical protein HanXRQr2_Chr04g0164341 [Helianthus annuus]KAJ0580921.1 hypothetical protein HanHA300_Chr04g0134961 [Helianthus annuus]KAJ0588659.1 hypothetical protein HanIR_Chr04g0177241 [Helianthus annuus]KAJ0757541.1 hypothetical protein HanLR1_Chr04g0139941 [Helianthus annuus]KAJ0926673.1 hypothetical protein HanRHA438_Chr04g0174011 [Helianthus annuus]
MKSEVGISFFYVRFGESIIDKSIGVETRVLMYVRWKVVFYCANVVYVGVIVGCQTVVDNRSFFFIETGVLIMEVPFLSVVPTGWFDLDMLQNSNFCLN